MMKKLGSLLVLFTCLYSVWGQEYRATLLGQVNDTQRAAVPKATIKATKEDTGLSKDTETNSEGTNQFLLNGAPISSNGTWNVAPNVEAIQEFKVMVNTYDAQYGRSGGGHVNTIIRAGANDWHGSLFDFWRNTVLDANTRQNNIVAASRGKRNQHQFGGTVGGAVRKNKDFVFFSFEGWQERVPFPTVTDAIPLELRNGAGFSRFNQTIYDPLTSRLCVSGADANPCVTGGQFIRNPFPSNVLPGSRISPIARTIVGYYPGPNGPSVTYNQNYFGSGNTGRYRYEQ